MNDNTKDFENTNLTDEQTAEVAGGYPVVSRPFPRNAKLEDEQTEEVSGGYPVVSRPFPRNAKLDDGQLDQVSGGRQVRSGKLDEDEPTKFNHLFGQSHPKPH